VNLMGQSEHEMLRATVSGSFRRHMSAIYEAVTELVECGVSVLSPADPRVVEQIGEFVFVASDKVRSIKMVEDRHLECIGASDFLWLVAPDGYVGQSASMELGYAIARSIPIFCQELPNDGTLQKYVQTVPNVGAALLLSYAARQSAPRVDTFLIDVGSAINDAHERLDAIRDKLSHDSARIRDDAAGLVAQERDTLARILRPSRPRVPHELVL
jgi:hypothetical protein